MTLEVITAQKAVLRMLCEGHAISHHDGRAFIVDASTREELYRINQNTFIKLVANKLLTYDGGYSITDKGKSRAGLINGRFADEPCAMCSHTWGQHAQRYPHKCTICADYCMRFTEHAVEGDI